MSQALNPHLKLINGWYFDFAHMKAYRAAAWENPSNPRERELHDRGNGTIGKRYKHELKKFFDPPEERFNDEIDMAYVDYLFENEVLKQNV